MQANPAQNKDLKQYIAITGNYWAFTLTDGALRMLVVLYFHQLGYSPLQIALLFLFYEFFGVVTNLVGGWLGARIGLNRTMNIGLSLQIIALAMLMVPTSMLSVAWVMAAQALSGIAKDLNKMSAKSSVKLLVSDDQQSTLYKWVAILTGSKNTLKGVGFFLGGVLLTWLGFQGAVMAMAIMLSLVLCSSLFYLKKDIGKSKAKPKFSQIFSKSRNINLLSACRLFLFGARDVWFVVALPVYLASQFNWSHWQVGGFLATWVILYGFVQTIAPKLTRSADGNSALLWSAILALIPASIVLALNSSLDPIWVIIIGLLSFGFVFAINSSLHSFLIVSYASRDSVSLDVGFYYMANAMGRLIGTVLSGWIYQLAGLNACLLVSSVMIAVCFLVSFALPKQAQATETTSSS
jgi:predicted MFS family arabinose efflux permease